MRTILFLLLFASPLLAQDEALLNRVRPLAGKNTSCAVVYSAYPSGRPRLVVAGTDLGHFDMPGELLLIRFPDAKNGGGRVVDRLAFDAGVMEINFVHLADPKDIAVVLHLKYSQGILMRIVREKLIQIAGTLPTWIADLDGDGIPELIAGYDDHPRPGPCGWRGHPVILRWRWKDYEEDDRDYVGMAIAKVGESGFRDREDTSMFETPLIPQHGGHQYVVHFYRGRGDASPHILIDGVAVAIETPLALKDQCHTLDLEVTGSAGAEGWAFVEERP